MTTQTVPLPPSARRAARLAAVAIAVVAMSVLTLPPAAPAATRQAGGDRLAAASHAVAQSGVRGRPFPRPQRSTSAKTASHWASTWSGAKRVMLAQAAAP